MTYIDYDKGPSINYVFSKLSIFNPLPLFAIFFLHKIIYFWPPSPYEDDIHSKNSNWQKGNIY